MQRDLVMFLYKKQIKGNERKYSRTKLAVICFLDLMSATYSSGDRYREISTTAVDVLELTVQNPLYHYKPLKSVETRLRMTRNFQI